MKFSTAVLASVLCIASSLTWAQGKDKGAKDFVTEAAAAGMAEVEMGKLGVQKATNADVKAYAQRMVTDHTKANMELETIAKSKGISVPSSPDMMHKAIKEKFEHQSSGQEFDKDFMQQMVKDHTKVVKLFETASTDQSLDSELQAFAKKTVPTLRNHLTEAQALVSKVGGK